MADSEKLTALKKAYADTILNTAKEAAVRLMDSERKALGYQQELMAVRDEALRTLLRLKQMFDSKVKEAEMVSLTKHKKIEELEAQLGEAEDIVEELRMELRELQDELEKATNSQMNRHDEEKHFWGNSETVCSLPEDNINHKKLETMESSGLVGQRGLVMTNGMKNLFLNGMDNISQCCYKDNGNGCHHSLPSILTRHKEAEVLKGGCSQLTHPSERNIANIDFSASKKADGVKYEAFVKKETEGAHAVVSPPREGHKFSSDKSSASQSIETLQISYCSDASDCPSSDEHEVRDGENAQVSCKSSQMYSVSSISLKTASSAWESDSKLLTGEKVSGKEENGNDESVELPLSASHEEGPASPADKRCIKYTFKRKRKKDTLGSPDRDSSTDESGLSWRQKTGEKDEGYVRSQMSNLNHESSCDG